jgi:hypothetical protein
VAGVLPFQQWVPYLASHPDQAYAEFLRRGIWYGFRVGFNCSQPLKLAKRNYESALQQPSHAQCYIDEEVRAGRLRQLPGDSGAHWSPIGLVPKDHQPDKFRLIIDLSSPAGHSVNDGINPNLTSLKYSNVTDAVALVKKAGVGALMAKLDLKAAYRRVPVHPDDQGLLAIKWGGSIYLDTALPFGLSSAPKIFTAMADGLAWCMAWEGIEGFIHYLDDYFFCSSVSSTACQRALDVAVPLCGSLGFPVAPEKVVPPATVITFLGIEIDSIKFELRLPKRKLDRLKETIQRWLGRRAASKRQLQSVIGLLSDAAVVAPQGKAFLRSLIDTMKIPKKPDHLVRINRACQADLHWWDSFLTDWNGISFFPGRQSSQVVTSDASGSWGCGAYWPGDANCVHWIQLSWPPHWQATNIASKELLPVVVSAAIWGPCWRGQRILYRLDNQAAVGALNSHSARDDGLSHLLRCLFFIEAKFDLEHEAVYLPGSMNVAADAISRNNTSTFLSLFPQADKAPAHLPPTLVELLMDQSIMWTSQRWRDLFSVSFSEAWPPERGPPMHLHRESILSSVSQDSSNLSR